MHEVESPASAATGAQSVSLPSIRQAASWGRATDDLLAALEREEAEAMAVFEKARERVKAARKAAGAMRQIRDLVSMNGAPKSAAAAPAPRTDGASRWARDFERCTNCGTTSVKHASRGRCRACDTYWRSNGHNRVVEAVS